MVEVFKIINGIDKSDIDQLFSVQSESRSRGHSQKLFKEQFRLDLRKHFFSQRVVDEWNSLSEEIVTSETVNQFKVINFGKKKQQSLNQTAIPIRLRMLDNTNFMYVCTVCPKNHVTF